MEALDLRHVPRDPNQAAYFLMAYISDNEDEVRREPGATKPAANTAEISAIANNNSTLARNKKDHLRQAVTYKLPETIHKAIPMFVPLTRQFPTAQITSHFVRPGRAAA